MRELHPNGVLDMDIESLTEILSEGTFRYYPTKEEVGALRWICYRYASSSYLLSVLVDDSWGVDTAVHMDIDPLQVKAAFADDDAPFVPCLAPNTALYKLTLAAGKVKKVRPPAHFEGTQEEYLRKVLAPLGLTILRTSPKNFVIRGNTPETRQQLGEQHLFPGRGRLEEAIPKWIAQYNAQYP